jgi:ubiquinol-cytochrome c reductase cytochrome b subunit
MPVYDFIYSSFRWHKAFLFTFLGNHIIYYSTPANLTYSWSFGSLAGVSLVIQIVSGVFLGMFYTPHVDLAFASVEFIMRDVNHGWLIRYIHSNGASMFFFVVYCHILRGLYYGSYAKPRELLWISGVVLLLLMMATAFLGYVLPWGQMSFWGATVITSMFSVIPKFGTSIVEWLWGGFTVNNPTLNRFFCFHFFLPFVITGVVFLHLLLLHKEGSSAPISDSTGVDQIAFYPYFFVKDLYAFFCFFLVFAGFVLYYPNLLGDPNNYILADSIHTPRHIVPEWYFLPFYAMLRSIPHKVAGILTMAFSLLVLFLLPFLNTSLVKDSSSRMFFRICYFAAIADFLVLGWLGQSPVEDWYILVGQIATVYYFVFFIILLPFSGTIETLWVFHRRKKSESPRFPWTLKKLRLVYDNLTELEKAEFLFRASLFIILMIVLAKQWGTFFLYHIYDKYVYYYLYK